MTHHLIPTASGQVTLTEALTRADELGSIDSGEMGSDVGLLLMLTLLRDRAAALSLSEGEYLERFAEGFDLQGERPFLQVPEAYTRDLPWENPSILMIKYASGQESTMLSPHLRSTLIPLSPQQALIHLLITQTFGGARGKTKREYSCNAPAANQVIFTLHGQTLNDDIELNRLGLAPRPAAHEGVSDWTPWLRRELVEQDATTTRLWPWKTVTLNFRGDTCNAVRLASGTHNPSEKDSDLLRPPHSPYATSRRIQKGNKTLYLRLNNPTSREAYTALCQTLHAALSGDEDVLLPHNLRHLSDPRARTLRSSAQITRPGKPVVLDLTQAELRLPPMQRAAEGAALLQLALSGLSEVQQLGSSISRPARRGQGERQPERAVSHSVPGTYWKSLWPELNVAMQTLNEGELQRAIRRAQAQAIGGVISEADHQYNPALTIYAQGLRESWHAEGLQDAHD